jgi:hypothetical protein
MPVAVEPEAVVRNGEPAAGVIRDARFRQARRRRGAAAAAVLAMTTAAAWLVADSGSSHRHGGAPANAAAIRARLRAGAAGARLSPILEGGEYGWCVVTARSGSCPLLPQGLVTTVDLGGTELPGAEPIKLVLAPGVADVLIDGHRGRMATLARLPYRLRLARVTFPRGSGVVYYARTLRAIDANGKAIAPSEPIWGTGAPPVQVRIRWWQKPQPLPSGPCQIRAHGLAGLQPQWGHVASAIRAYPGKLIGRAFFSCIDTEYYLRNWPLEAAILLDAQTPGRIPAPIPDMKSVSGARGLYNAPGDWHGEITAVRRGDVWLVVAGGSGLAQRIEVLRHLSARVSL